jgi:hypothetical protein
MGAFNLIGAAVSKPSRAGVHTSARSGKDIGSDLIAALKILEAPINCIQHDKGMK